MNNSPIFSIIIPTKDRPYMCQRAVESVLKQDFNDYEIIIIDDGSKDIDSYNWISPLIDDGIVNFIRNKESRGPSYARNKGLYTARGKYIALLDDDDEYLHSFLTETYKALENCKPNVGVTWSGIVYTDDSSGESPDPTGELRNFDIEYDTTRDRLQAFMSVGTGYGICLTRECLDHVGGFDEDLVTTEDTEWFLRIIAHGYEPFRIPGAHVIVHNHSEPKLTHARNSQKNLKECEWLLERHSDFFKDYEFLENQIRGHMNNVLNGVSDQLT